MEEWRKGGRCGWQVGLGCAHLEEALGLLEEAGFPPGMSKLASEIQEGLRELKPHCVLEHLKVCCQAPFTLALTAAGNV